MSLLRTILRHKKGEVRVSKKAVPFTLIRKAALSLPRKKTIFLAALRASRSFAVIAEIKHRSPSKGVLSKSFDPVRIARQYEKAGAAALSVLTDKKFFGGSPEFIRRIQAATRLPVLRKDFILEEYQVYESRLLGADAILLIASALGKAKMRVLYRLAASLGLDTLFEVHNLAELKKVLPLKPRLVGVNNRDLRSFRVDLAVSERLARHIPKNILFVSESGIQTREDLKRLRSAGARAALVGESLMREKDPGRALKRLLGKSRG